MKILYITPDYPPSFGGIGSYTARTISAIERENVKIFLLIARFSTGGESDANNLPQEARRIESPYDNVVIVEILLPYKNHYGIKTNSDISSDILVNRAYQDADWIVYDYIMSNLSINEFDLIISNDLFFGMCSTLLHDQYHIPLLTIIHMVTRGVIEPMKSYRKYILANSSALITPANYIKKELKEIIGNGAPPIYYSPINIDIHESQVPDDSFFRILYVGRMEYQKGVDILLESIYMLQKKTDKPFKLDLVGQGSYLEDLKHYVHVNNLSELVNFHGYLEAEDINTAYALASVVVVPSRHELVGTVALEAMAHGVPVIASAIGGLLEVMEGDAGLLFTSENANELSDILAECSSDTTMMQNLSSKGKNKIIRCHSSQNTQKAFDRAFSDLVRS